MLYIADGACNAVVAISHASALLLKDEITVQPGCKKFTCEYPTPTCGKLVKAGSPLDKPVAPTLLPNGNLIVANAGNNTLVEMTPKGKVLDTEVIDTEQGTRSLGSPRLERVTATPRCSTPTRTPTRCTNSNNS